MRVKHWKPGKETVALPASAPRPSRIRRDPAKIDAKRLDEKVEPRSREQEIVNAVIGVALIAVGCASLIVGVSAVTSSDGPAAAAAASGTRFTHCSSNFGPNCVLDGDTFYINREKIEVAGIDAPEIRGARCTAEARRGIQSAIALHELLNRGKVTLMGTERASDGSVGQKVEADGRDVGPAMIAAGAAREYRSEGNNWCG